MIMRYLVTFIIILLLSTASFADETKPENWLLESNKTKELSFYSLDRLSYTEDIDADFVNQVTFDYRIRGTIRTKLVGIYDIIADQAKRRLKRYARRQIRIFYNHSNIPDFDINKMFNALNADHNPYGNWWSRPWWASFTPENGGAPLEQTELRIGPELQLPDWAIVQWGKRQFNKLGDIWITNDHAYEGIEDGDTTVVPGETPKSNGTDRLNKNNGRKDVDVILDDTPWFSGTFYHFRFKPSLRIRGGPDAINIIDEVSLKFVIELYTIDSRNTHFGNLSFFFRYNLPKNDALVSVTFDLITW